MRTDGRPQGGRLLWPIPSLRTAEAAIPQAKIAAFPRFDSAAHQQQT